MNILNGSNGTNGTPGSVWSIDGTTGFWMVDGAATGYRAVGVNAKAPYINAADSMWYIPQWDNDRNIYEDVPTTIKAAGNETFISYVTGSAGNYTLHVRNNADKSWADIPLYTSSTPSGATIELLGYVQGSAINPAGNLSLASIIDTATLALRFWHIPDPAAFTSPWNYQKMVRAGQTFSDLPWNYTHLVISTNASGLTGPNLKLKNYSDETMPLAFGTPVQLNGLLTRSATGPFAGTIYYIPFEVDTVTYPDALAAGFTLKFKTGALYYLTDAASGLKSNFSAWTINPLLQTTITPSYILTVGGSGPVSGVYTVNPNVDNVIGFDGNAQYICDYYVSYPGANAGVTVNPLNGTFKTTAAISPQDTVVVHKLYVNGDLVNDTLTIKTP
jgi:hypothetical protein